MDTVEFLSLVCPSEGFKYIAVQTPHPSEPRDYLKHYATESLEEAARIALDWDDTDKNVYFSCVSFKEAEYKDAKGKTRRRTHSNAYKVRAFWRDIDVGYNEKGKLKPNAYESQEEAINAVHEFCSKTGFPTPLIVSSGAGIHIYWPLSREIDAAAWVPMAKLLTQVLIANGVRTDPSRDHDLSSVLRPVGTHNKKPSGVKPVEVRVVHDRALRPKEMVDLIVSNLPEEIASGATVPSYLQGTTSVTSALAGQAIQYPPADASLIADKCGQLAEFRSTGGGSYLNWWLSLGVMKHCVNGEALAHEWSAKSDDYDSDTTQFKIDEWSAGPASCEAFESCGDHCKTCQFKGKIKSPIRLGVSETPSESQTTIPLVAEDDDEETTVEVVGITLPYGFVFHDDTVCKIVVNDGISSYVPVSNIAFWAEARYRNLEREMVIQCRCRLRKNGDSWKLHKFEVPAEVFGKGGAALFGEFAKHEIYPAKGARKLMEDYILSMADDLRKRRDEVNAYRTFGWQADNSFLLGTSLITVDGVKTVVVGGDAAPSFTAALEPRGDHIEWCSLVEQMYAHPEHEEYQMTVMFAIGAPLLELYKMPTGCPVNLLGDKGLGKTTSAEVGLTAYGAPDVLGTKWESTTELALYSRLSTLKNLPVLVDEMTNADPQGLSRVIYSIANGKPRDRLQSSGRRTEVPPSWALPTIMSSNAALMDKLAGQKADASAEISRLIEVSWRKVETIARNEMDALLVELRKHQGALGMEFLKFAVANRAKVERILFKVREGLEEQAGLSKEYRFWSAHFAVPIAALYICQKYLGVLQNFSVDALFDFILALAKKQKQDLSEWVMQPVDILHHMITKMSGGIIVTNGEKDGRNGALDSVSIGGMEPIGRIIRDTGNLFLSVRAVRDWCSAHRVQYTTMKDTMEEQGVLLGTKRYYIGKGTSIPTGQEYCLHLDWNKLQKVGTTIGETVVKLQAVK